MQRWNPIAAVCKSKKWISLPKIDHSNLEICFSISIIANPIFLYILPLARHEFQGQQYMNQSSSSELLNVIFLALGASAEISLK